MSKWIFEEREHALEEMFFMQKEKEAIEKLRQSGEKEKQIEHLKNISGITDKKILSKMIEIGMNAESFGLISLAPLVAVAWADQTLDANEKDNILKFWKNEGIGQSLTGYSLVESWLHKNPGQDLLVVWKNYIKVLATKISGEELELLREDVVGKATQTAMASGGIWGVGTVSENEQKVVAEIDHTFKSYL